MPKIELCLFFYVFSFLFVLLPVDPHVYSMVVLFSIVLVTKLETRCLPADEAGVGAGLLFATHGTQVVVYHPIFVFPFLFLIDLDTIKTLMTLTNIREHTYPCIDQS